MSLFFPDSAPALTTFLSNPPAATEDSPELGVGSESEEGASEGASRTRAHRPHTLATLTGIGERTLRSLTNGSTTPGDAGRSEAEDTESATLQGNVTAAGDSHLVSSSLAASRTLGGDGTGSIFLHILSICLWSRIIRSLSAQEAHYERLLKGTFWVFRPPRPHPPTHAAAEASAVRSARMPPRCGLGQSPGKEMSHYTAWKVGRVFLFPCRRNNCSIWGLKSFSDTNLLLSKKKKKKPVEGIWTRSLSFRPGLTSLLLLFPRGHLGSLQEGKSPDCRLKPCPASPTIYP